MRSNRAVGVILLLGSLFFLCIGIYAIFFSHRGYEETTATISRIEATGVGKSRKVHDYVTYEVNGVRYEAALNVHQSNFREGMQVKIFYDPSDPSKISGDWSLVGYYVTGISGISTLISLISIFGRGKKYDYKQ